ncbi:transcriptional regulator [Modestobacter caceresii]|uniref:Transcriptional regulator n=1 Tax=Modestobacter caceresii TaxID=1522368 RepID=A0A098Y3T7_9ACTN|nr:metalloregulator ArsR/SmtB family transcription factor [Modestobacter caceresii]KGH45149.1 transcriptional regulator [Modestobacter caceresii]
MESAAARAAVPSAGAPAEDGRTRDRVSSLLLEHGPQTAAELAGRLGISPAAVRRHLDGLVAAGHVAELAKPRSGQGTLGVAVAERQRGRRDTEREAPGGQRGRGRPARRFALTDAGRESFPHAYDDLALTALRFVAEHGGPDAVRAVAEQQLSGLAQRCSTAVESALEEAAPGAGEVDRAQVLAVALTAEGYAATASAISSGGQLCQHHCPVAHVAAEFPQLCEAETAVISRLVGTHVQRLATIAHGDGICTTHIPAQLALRAGLRAGSQAGNKATPARPVPAGRATPSGAGASTRTTPSIDRERTPA